jgi:hypothetical protein
MVVFDRCGTRLGIVFVCVDLVENYVKIERHVSSLIIIIIIIIIILIYSLFSPYVYEHENFGKFIPQACPLNGLVFAEKTSSDFGRLPLIN